VTIANFPLQAVNLIKCFPGKSAAVSVLAQCLGSRGGSQFATRRCSKIFEFFSRQLAQEPIKKQKNRDAARQMPVFPRSKIFSKK